MLQHGGNIILRMNTIKLFPILKQFSRYNRSFTSDVLNSTQNPIWNKKHIFVGVENDEWNSSKLEISVWNYSSNADPKCLGKIKFTLHSTLLNLFLFTLE